jgi:hypothetical protein
VATSTWCAFASPRIPLPAPIDGAAAAATTRTDLKSSTPLLSHRNGEPWGAAPSEARVNEILFRSYATSKTGGD